MSDIPLSYHINYHLVIIRTIHINRIIKESILFEY
nr:MAG TPA: hypothetical protein [Bacteriophage sp.]